VRRAHQLLLYMCHLCDACSSRFPPSCQCKLAGKVKAAGHGVCAHRRPN
jgi:hypothetical protein